MPSPSLFLTLPPDIRQRIYNHLLVAAVPIKGPIARRHHFETYDIHTSILRVNKQISSESKPIFFGLNTFSISSVPLAPSPEDDSETEEGSGAFEPPLQLKDLDLVRNLEVNLVYAGRGRAERYIASLSFLLAHATAPLTQLTLVGDARPLTQADGALNHRKFLSGYYAATSNARFQAALAALPLQCVDVKFEFDDIRFDFNLQKEVLMGEEWSFSWLAGQVLFKRVELGLGGVMEHVEGMEGDEMVDIEEVEKS